MARTQQATRPRLDPHGKCPECGSCWDGGEIPKDLREGFSPPYKWSRLIGLEDPAVYDGISWWVCPDCGAHWDRWTKELVKKGSEKQPVPV